MVEGGENVFETFREGVFLESGEAGFFTDEANLSHLLAPLALGFAIPIPAGGDCEVGVSVWN